MDGTRLGNRRGVGSVKDAVNLFDERLAGTDDAPSLKPPSRTRELHKVKNDIGRYKESRWTAESAKARAESELSNAKKTVKSLSSLIEDSSNKAKMQMRDIATLEKRRKNQNGALVVKRNEHHEYANVMRELECVKRDLFKLKLDVASVLEQKSRAEKEFEESSSKMINCSRTAEGLRKEIEEANEEQVLAELARIEALKELEEIEAQRRKEANEHEAKLESMRKKMKEAIEEIEESKELEKKLAVTMSDVELLQNELNSVKENEKRAKGNEGIKQFEAGFAKEEESEGTAMMSKNIKEELEAAKKELALIKEEGFQFMVSMDVIRNELNHVTAETVRLKKEEGKVDSTVLNLNSKFLRAKSKLESVSAAEQKAKSILMSLTHTLDNLKTERDNAKKEKDLISQEVTATSAEIQKIESEIDMTEERLRDAMQELEVAKTSEALALEKLKTLAENTMRERASSSQHGSVITISKFEYEYLTNHASAAEEIADKKVEAAQAWIEAFKASEREILMKTKIAQKELKETKLMEKQAEEKFLARRVSNEEFENWPRKRERSNSKNFQRAMSRRSFKSNGSITPARRMKFQKSSSPAATRLVSPFPVKTRRKVIPNFAKFFRGKKSTRTAN